MQVNYKGLLVEKLPSGETRYRVRPMGNAKRKITIHCGPGDKDFSRQYILARHGEKPERIKPASETAMPQSIGWLVSSYLEYLEKQVDAGISSAKTLKKKRNLLMRLISDPSRKMLIPEEKLLEMQDAMIASPAQAEAFIEAVRVMYDWALSRKYIKENTASNIAKVYRKGNGAIPWRLEDFHKFFATHKMGTTPHVAMSLILGTGARIGDLIFLGRAHECLIDGAPAIKFQPSKKGSSEVCVPLYEPLRAALRAPKVQGAVYVLGRGGKPYASEDAMSAMFKRWCRQAGLGHLSAHGVRKYLAQSMAQLGSSQYEIMSVLGHSEAKTSEIYTKGASRQKLAFAGMGRVKLDHGDK